MSVRVAIIGAGVMGGDHARIFCTDVSGAVLQVLCDADGSRAKAVADGLGVQNIASNPEAVIDRDDVDAVVIASPDDTHASLTLRCLEKGKPVLCEKPLAPSVQDCLAVLEAEVKLGRRLIQTGFMRRFDPSYQQMKAALDEGRLGSVTMMHNFHRNVVAPDWFTGEMAITNSAPHEFDITRYVLGTEYQSIVAFQGQGQSAVAPVFMVLQTNEKQIVNVEINNNATYGYHVKGELVGENGSIELATPHYTTSNLKLSTTVQLAADWRPRFAEAYRLQNQAWIKSIVEDKPNNIAASAWDGYCATAVAEAGVQSLKSQSPASVSLVEKPPLYN